MNIWGVSQGSAVALPVVTPTPADPTTMAYVIYWNTAEQALDYAPLAFDPTTGNGTLGANFGLALNKVYKINSVQVVGARKTGWAGPAGTATRTTFDTGTVTTTQLAERVKALIDDLTSHGLIGS